MNRRAAPVPLLASAPKKVRKLTRGACKVLRALAAGLSQEELGLRVGCSQSMICAIAHGTKRPRSVSLVKGLERELGISPADWFEFDCRI